MVNQTSTVALPETVLPTANISSSSESVSDDKTIMHVHISYCLVTSLKFHISRKYLHVN